MHRPFRAWVATAVFAALSPVAYAAGPNKTAAPVRQVFQKPTDGVITNNFAGHANDPSKGVDVQSPKPPASSPLCRAEPGSVDMNGAPLTTGDWDPNRAGCEDFEGAAVYAATAGFLYFGEVAQPRKSDKTPSYPHIVRISHGTLNGVPVETEYWHVGTKVRDGRYDWFGNAVSSFIVPMFRSDTWRKSTKGICVNAGEQIASQGYSGNTTATHLHYVLKEGSVEVDPELWFANVPADLVPPSQCPVLTVTKAGNGAGKVATNAPVPAPTPYYAIDCGTGVSDCSEMYREGTQVVLAAVYDPAADYLAGWTGCDSASGDVCDVTINSARSVTATINPNPVCPSVSGSAYIETPLDYSSARQNQSWTVTADQPVWNGTLTATDGGATTTMDYQIRIDNSGGVCRVLATLTGTATGGARARMNSANEIVGRVFLDSLKLKERLLSQDCSTEVQNTQPCPGCRPPSMTDGSRCISEGSTGDSPYPAQSNWAEISTGSTLSTQYQPPGLDFAYIEWSTNNSGTSRARVTFAY